MKSGRLDKVVKKALLKKKKHGTNKSRKRKVEKSWANQTQ